MLPERTVAYAFVSGPYPDVPRAYPGIWSFLERMNWYVDGPIRHTFMVPPGENPEPDALLCLEIGGGNGLELLYWAALSGLPFPVEGDSGSDGGSGENSCSDRQRAEDDRSDGQPRVLAPGKRTALPRHCG